MRVTVPNMTAISGTNGSITSANEPNEIATSTGYFYAVITGTARPFREPGIDIRDVPIPGAPSGIAQFDDNPERILVDSVIAGGTSLEISTGARLSNVTGVLDFTFSNDSFYDPSRLILDAAYDRTQVTGGITVQPVAAQTSSQFTVASFNIERFYNTNSADDLYYVPAGVNGFNGSSSTPIVSTGQTFISQAVDVTQAAYTRRLQKVSLAIRTVLNTPDIVTLEEVENQSVANDIANQINTDAGVPNLYTAYSTDNSAFYSQDGTGISVGFLVKNSTVDKLGFTQFGQGESFTYTGGTSPITLNDRPWLVLNAGIKRGAAKDYPVTVIVNHMKALTGVNSTTSTSTRQKKELQAEDIAKYIQTLQAAGQHVISGGDFNAFEFSDGYTDTLATYTNTNVLPATQVVQPGVAGLVTPPLVDLALNLPANQRWSYVEDGNAQILDHIVVTPELVTAGAYMAYAHLNSDFPLTAYNDATTAARTSDHDAAVGYFTIPAPVLPSTSPASPPPAHSLPATTAVHRSPSVPPAPSTSSSLPPPPDRQLVLSTSSPALHPLHSHPPSPALQLPLLISPSPTQTVKPPLRSPSSPAPPVTSPFSSPPTSTSPEQ
jgi:predicted extracellular nuclease